MQKDGPVVPLGELKKYFQCKQKNRRKLLNVVSLRLAGTPLEVRPARYDLQLSIGLNT